MQKYECISGSWTNALINKIYDDAKYFSVPRRSITQWRSALHFSSTFSTMVAVVTVAGGIGSTGAMALSHPAADSLTPYLGLTVNAREHRQNGEWMSRTGGGGSGSRGRETGPPPRKWHTKSVNTKNNFQQQDTLT